MRSTSRCALNFHPRLIASRYASPRLTSSHHLVVQVDVIAKYVEQSLQALTARVDALEARLPA